MLRAKITPVIDPETGAIVVTIEWIDAETREFQKTEQFQIMPNRVGSSYVSSVQVEQCLDVAPYWIDEKGLRHFVAHCETAAIGATV